MIVGHNPGLEPLVAQLTGAEETLPTAALAQICSSGSMGLDVERCHYPREVSRPLATEGPAISARPAKFKRQRVWQVQNPRKTRPAVCNFLSKKSVAIFVRGDDGFIQWKFLLGSKTGGSWQNLSREVVVTVRTNPRHDMKLDCGVTRAHSCPGSSAK